MPSEEHRLSFPLISVEQVRAEIVVDVLAVVVLHLESL